MWLKPIHSLTTPTFWDEILLCCRMPVCWRGWCRRSTHSKPPLRYLQITLVLMVKNEPWDGNYLHMWWRLSVEIYACACSRFKCLKKLTQKTENKLNFCLKSASISQIGSVDTNDATAGKVGESCIVWLTQLCTDIIVWKFLEFLLHVGSNFFLTCQCVLNKLSPKKCLPKWKLKIWHQCWLCWSFWSTDHQQFNIWFNGHYSSMSNKNKNYDCSVDKGSTNSKNSSNALC